MSNKRNFTCAESVLLAAMAAGIPIGDYFRSRLEDETPEISPEVVELNKRVESKRESYEGELKEKARLKRERKAK